MVSFKLWLKLWPNSRSKRQVGNLVSSKLWLKLLPNMRFSRPSGKVAYFKFWLNLDPNVKLLRLVGSTVRTILWSNRESNCNDLMPIGRPTASTKLPLKENPKGILFTMVRCKNVDRVVVSKIWLNFENGMGGHRLNIP